MFGHDTKGGLFINQADVGSKNPDNSDALLFSKLGQLENYRNYDGTFKFKLCYPELTWGVNKEKCNEWIQSSNPLTDSTITGFVAISLAFTKNGDLRDWKGLGKASPQLPTAIDDAPETSFRWFSSIGATQFYPSKGFIPGPRNVHDAHLGKVTKVELYVVEPHDQNITKPAGRYLSLLTSL